MIANKELIKIIFALFFFFCRGCWQTVTGVSGKSVRTPVKHVQSYML